jgi:hypothetical protein
VRQRQALGVLITTVCLSLALPLAAAEPAKGVHRPLTIGELFVPEAYKPDGNAIHLVVHLHGSVQAAEENLLRQGAKAVLVSIVRPGLSQVYTDLFNTDQVFASILRDARRKLRELGVAPQPRFSKVTVVSFSAGFGGVREILKSEEAYRRIDELVMADTIYAGYVGDPARRQVNPAHMAEWVRFARDAAAGNKAMVISHCDLEPGAYASTQETADYLLAKLGARRVPADEWWAEKWHLTSTCSVGRLRLYGFSGTTGEDHMRHLFNAWQLVLRVPPEPPAGAAPSR